jgi:hypothetical protein
MATFWWEIDALSVPASPPLPPAAIPPQVVHIVLGLQASITAAAPPGRYQCWQHSPSGANNDSRSRGGAAAGIGRRGGFERD